jgi:hypothetical protein
MEIGEQVGNRLARGAASIPAQELRTKVEQRSAIDDVRASLSEIEYMRRTGSTATQGVVLRRLVWRLAEIGLFDEAVVIAGADSRASVNLPMRAREAQRHAAVLASLLERIGEQRYDQLYSRGALFTADELMSTVQAVADEVDARSAP